MKDETQKLVLRQEAADADPGLLGQGTLTLILKGISISLADLLVLAG